MKTGLVPAETLGQPYGNPPGVRQICGRETGRLSGVGPVELHPVFFKLPAERLEVLDLEADMVEGPPPGRCELGRGAANVNVDARQVTAS